MSSELFIPIKFSTIIEIQPIEICVNIEEVIYKKLKNKLESTCSKHGYIKKDSIKIIKRSIGQLRKNHFNGNIIYNLQCIAEICNPVHGSIVKCKVKAKNSMGILAEGFYENIPILEIIIPKISAGIRSEIDIETINIGDEINIEVCGKKFMLFDKHISIIGKALKDKEEFIINDDVGEVEEVESVNNDIIDDEILLDLDVENDEEEEKEDEEEDEEEEELSLGDEEELDDIIDDISLDGDDE
jgi:DNA-directed RNA polymerase subunit E'/Rpb7